MDVLVLTIKEDKKVVKMKWDLPKTVVLERDEEGHATKVNGPFKNGKLKPSIVLSAIADVMVKYYGQESLNAAERVEIWMEHVRRFPAKIFGQNSKFYDYLQEMKDWLVRLDAFSEEDPDALAAYLLHRSLVRTFNSWANGNEFNDTMPTDDDDETEEETL